MLHSPTSPASAAAGPSSSTSPQLHNDHEAAPTPYSFGYRSFPNTAQSPPTTASTMRPSLSGMPPPPSSSAASFAPSTIPRPPMAFSRDDTEKSRIAYETLSSSAKAYRVALGQLSGAASNFGAALEACARLKEARAEPYPSGPFDATRGGVAGNGLMSSGSSMYEASCTADVLLAASGLYFLMANQQRILAETVYRSFELPIVHELDRYAADVEAEEESYAAAMREASRDIRRLEKEGVKLRKPRQRDVGRMRSHLVTMTAALDALTARQGEHAIALLDQSRDMSGTVSQASRNLVRAEVDILDSLARKGWPGGGLDVVLEGAIDVFSHDDTTDDDILGGGTPLNGVGIGIGIGSSSSSSHAVVSGAGGILGSAVGDPRLAPKLLLLGGGSSDKANDDGNRTFETDGYIGPIIDIGAGAAADDGTNGDDADNDDDDNKSDASTIHGNASSRPKAATAAPSSSTSSGGGFFSILTGGSILGRSSDAQKPRKDESTGASESRGRRLKKEPTPSSEGKATTPSQQRRSGSVEPAGQRPQVATSKQQEEPTSETTAPPPPQVRSTRADSLSVDTAYHHQYQSLDSLAQEAHGTDGISDTASTHSRRASASVEGGEGGGGGQNRGRGRSRPFSPQRVNVDPLEDLFSVQYSSSDRPSLAWMKEGEPLETPHEDDEEKADAEAAEAGSDKGKGKGKGAETATASSRASSIRPRASEETDEGVSVWRQDG